MLNEVAPLLADQIKTALASMPSASSGPQASTQSAPSSLLASLKNHLAPVSNKKSKPARAPILVHDSASESESDSDVETGDHGDSDPAPSLKSAVWSSLSIDDKVAPLTLSQMSIHGSFLKWFDKVQWKNSRNKRECHFLCTLLDVLLEEGQIGEDSLALELLVRRLNGINIADTTGNWEACSALQGLGPDHSLLSRDIVFKAMKQASKISKLTGRTDTSSKSSSSYSDSGKRYNRDSSRKYGSNYKSTGNYTKGTTSTSTAATGAQKQ